MNTKKCSKCNTIKPLTEFSKRKRSIDGLRSQCRQCVLDRQRIYRQKHREVLSDYQKKYREDNAEELSEKAKQRRLNNIEKYKARDKQYYIDNKEYINKQGRAWYDKNRDLCLNYNKQYYKENKIRIEAQKRKYTEEHVEEIAKYQKQYRKDNADEISKKKNIYNNSPAKYKTYKDKLTIDEAPRLAKDGVSIEAKCRYCGKYFKPTNNQVRQRISVLKEFGGGQRLYCSNNCKTACPTYGMRKYPKGFKSATSREVQPELRQLTLARDDYTCQKCGKTTAEAPLHCHHILPLNESPIESVDLENCISLCKDCHKEAHKLPGCGYHELKCSE